MERGKSVLCYGKIPKAPKSDGSCPKRYQKFPGCASTTEKSSLTQFLLDLSSSCSFSHLAKGNHCNKFLNTQNRWFCACWLAISLQRSQPCSNYLASRKPGCAWSQLPSNRTWYGNFESRQLKARKNIDKKDKFIFRLVIFTTRWKSNVMSIKF